MNPADCTRRYLLMATAAFATPRINSVGIHSFWVLKLLQPSSVIVRPFGTARLHCSSNEGTWIVEGTQIASVTCHSDGVSISGPAGTPVNCLLEIPNVIQRRYFGTFEIAGDGCQVIPVLHMDCETATASIVSAELPTSVAPPEALAAQAVVSRSILCARTEPRHRVADFCDTTHCQFLRSPAPDGGRVAQATQLTSGRVLLDRSRILAARYSAACGGSTDTIFDGDHHYVSVPCEICRKNKIPRRGHGWGLCQEGAIGLARLGWTWQAILTKYYPNTAIGHAPALF